MSADNYLLIRTHPDGGYTVTMEFASDPQPSEVVKTDPVFDLLEDAVRYADQWEDRMYCEYGKSTEEGL